MPVRTTNPATPVNGMIMVSGSGATAKPYYYNGVSWNAFY
jgi:hypothetical protein